MTTTCVRFRPKEKLVFKRAFHPGVLVGVWRATEGKGEGVVPEHFVIFSVEERRFALALPEVERIVAAVEIHPLPQAPAFVRGVVNVGGLPVPAVDLRVLWGLPPREVELSDRLLLVRSSTRLPSSSEEIPPRASAVPSGLFALLVDSVEGVSPLEPQEMSLGGDGPKLPQVALPPGEDRLLVLQNLEFLSSGLAALPGAFHG